MVNSNERGRAFESVVRRGILSYAVKKRVPATQTDRTKARDKIEDKYFLALDEATQHSFISGGWAFAKWVDKQGWFENATSLVLDRIPDNVAKKKDPTDIRLYFTYSDGQQEIKNISVKHRHSALCHPRLPSLAQQCGFEKGSKIDKEYRKGYEKIWRGFYEKVRVLKPKPKTYSDLDKPGTNYRYDWLYEPLQRNTVNFLKKYATTAEHASTYFKYLVGGVKYYVLKNEANYIEIKHFAEIALPKKFEITYPWHNTKTTFLIEFDNGWKITMRLHTASSKIEKNSQVFMTEKEDPICLNIEDVILLERVSKVS